MTRKKLYVGLAATVALSVAVFAWRLYREPHYPTGWYSLAKASRPEGVPKWNPGGVVTESHIVSYEPEAIFVDLPSLEVSSLKGKVKYLPYAASTDNRCAVGYVIELVAKPIPRDKIPERYTKEVVIPTVSGPMTLLPLKEASYGVHFVLQFLDSDGFEIIKIDTPSHIVISGQATTIQAQTKPALTLEQANLVKSVTVHMSVDKCLSAKSISTEQPKSDL